MLKKALIVDDSKTARVVLRQLLTKKAFEIDMVESGEEALGYLEKEMPDLIFMDHMMPGMNGFQAVKVIRANPETADIPVVMYTSKEGEVYVGQAHALGATDILTKPASMQELEQVLARLEKTLAKQAARVGGSDVVQTATVTPIREHRDDDEEWIEIPPPVSTEQETVRVNAEPSASSETQPDAEPVEQGDPSQPAAVSDSVIAGNGERESRIGLWRQVIAAVLIIAPVIWLLGLYFPAENHRQHLLGERTALLKAVQWAMNQSTEYDYADLPLANERLRLLKGLIAQLVAAEFRGTVIVEGHVGEFCLMEVPTEFGASWALPEMSLPLSECSAIGQTPRQSISLSSRQSKEFQRYLESSELLQASDIRVEIVAYGATKPAYSYPDDVANITAGEWNVIAQLNNRVEFKLIPAPQTDGESIWSKIF